MEVLNKKNVTYKQLIELPTKAKKEKYKDLRLAKGMIKRKKRKNFEEELQNIKRNLHLINQVKPTK